MVKEERMNQMVFIGIICFLLGVNIGLWTYDLWFGRFYRKMLDNYINLFSRKTKFGGKNGK